MAKKINGLRIVYIIVCLLVVGTGLVVTFTLQGASIDLTSAKVAELKVEGCDIANAVDRRVLFLETKWDEVIKGQKEILKAVKEK